MISQIAAFLDDITRYYTDTFSRPGPLQATFYASQTENFHFQGANYWFLIGGKRAVFPSFCCFLLRMTDGSPSAQAEIAYELVLLAFGALSVPASASMMYAVVKVRATADSGAIYWSLINMVVSSFAFFYEKS